jgi:hypothetical protein
MALTVIAASNYLLEEQSIVSSDFLLEKSQK